MTIGSRIQERMTELGLTQAQVAARAGISQTAVHKLVSGKSKETRKLAQVARALRCTPHWLTDGIGPKEAPAFPALVGYATGSISQPEPSYTANQTQEQTSSVQLTADERALVEAYRLLEPVDREDLVIELLRRAERIRRYVVRVQRQHLDPATEIPNSEG